MKFLVTGVAGFIGFHTALQLLENGHDVVGIDVMNDYYDPALKRARLEQINLRLAKSNHQFEFVQGNIADGEAMGQVFERHKFDRIIHLAAQAGVRYSMENPQAYVESNVVGFTHLIDIAAKQAVPHFLYASTSSVYGMNTQMPFAEHHAVDHPLQFYAATKRANELMAHAYSNLYQLPTTGLRFFTVYGPWGRPDMSPFLFAKKIASGEPIDVFNHGNHSRDFTYIDDIVDMMLKVADCPPAADPDWTSASGTPNTSSAPFQIFNIGNSAPVNLLAFIEKLEAAFGRKSERNYLPMQPGDVADTYADVSALFEAVNSKPKVSIEEGVQRFVRWYRDYYGV
ncbi:MAG: NAD-dependent epimerase [Pseudomonadota bacterium]